MLQYRDHRIHFLLHGGCPKEEEEKKAKVKANKGTLEYETIKD
jgi:hypothetical protein